MLFKPMEDYNNHSYYKKVVFEGNSIKTISNYGLAFYRGDGITIPYGIKNVYSLGLGYNSSNIMIFSLIHLQTFRDGV